MPVLKLVPRSVTRNAISVAEQSVEGVRRNFLRRFDFHPAIVLLSAVAIVALVSAIYLRQVTAAISANYTLQALQSEHANLVREQQDLQLATGRAQSLSTIEQVAKNTLHMVPIGDNYSYITVTNGPLTAMPPLPTPELEQEAGP